MPKRLIYLIPFVLMLGPVGLAIGTEGLKGEYYHRTTSAHEWQDLVLTRIDPTVNFDWGTGSPDPSIAGDFAVRWTGMIEAPNSETYTFHTNADAGVRLWVNNELIIDTWSDWVKWQANWNAFTGCRYDCSGDITLTGGQQYEIILEYGYGGNAKCELSWSTPTLTREVIPSRYLSVERPHSRNPDPADGAILRVSLVTLVWTPGDYTASHDVYLGENFDDVDAGAADTFRGNQVSASFTIGLPGVPYPDGLVPGTTYYWRIDEVNDLHPNSPWKGPVWSFAIAPRAAYNPNPADGAEFVNPNAELSWTKGFGAMLHYVYFGDNFDDVNNAAGGLPQGATTYTPGTLKLAKTYYWRVDEFDGLATHKGDVWSLTTQGAVLSLKPSNGAVDVKQTQIFSWSPGDYAASHQVYFGTDKEAVRNANTSSPEYKGTRNLGSESYDPGKLEWDVTYYWRVDEVNNTNPDSPWIGPVWSFTTANFLIVDDFEDYDAGENQIWYSWKDGLGYGTPGTEPYFAGNGTGSAVGDENTPSYTEETIVHGGNQSMPVFYDNSILRYSEVEKTLTYPRDWTENSVTTLTIWFRGNSANASETLYVALNGSAVFSYDNPDAAQINEWTQWNIDLQVFGINLANVNTIALGLGNKNNPQAGGSGTMYFDDIRLYPPPPEP